MPEALRQKRQAKLGAHVGARRVVDG